MSNLLLALGLLLLAGGTAISAEEKAGGNCNILLGHYKGEYTYIHSAECGFCHSTINLHMEDISGGDTDFTAKMSESQYCYCDDFLCHDCSTEPLEYAALCIDSEVTFTGTKLEGTISEEGLLDLSNPEGEGFIMVKID